MREESSIPDTSPLKPAGEKQISYEEAVAMAKAQIYGESIESGKYFSESLIEQMVKERAAEIMRTRNG